MEEKDFKKIVSDFELPDAANILLALKQAAHKGAKGIKGDSPVKSGWRGNLSGFVEGTDTSIKVSKITLTLDHDTAWALCNLLYDKAVIKTCSLEESQKPGISNLGAVLGRFIDHPCSNNGGREIIS